MDLDDIDLRIVQQRERLAMKAQPRCECPPSPTGRHDFEGNFYDPTSQRRLCRYCLLVFEGDLWTSER